MGSSSYEGGLTIATREYGSILKMYERRKGAEDAGADHDIHKDTFVGNAVLVGPRLAITAVHCLADPRQNLWVRSALGGPYVKVVVLRWRRDDHFFAFGSCLDEYPLIRSQNWAEDVVGLFLEREIRLPAAPEPVLPASVEEIGELLPDLVGVSAADGSVPRVRYSTFRPVRRINGTVIAEVSGPVMGYPLESGSAVVAWKDDALTTRLVGLQISAPDLIPLRLPKPGRMPIVGILPIDGPQLRSIRYWLTIKNPFKYELGARQVSARGPDLFFIRGLASGRSISGERSLMTISDLDFFECKVWTLHATRSRSGILTSGGLLRTRRIGFMNEVAVSVETVQTKERVEFTLYPSSPLGLGDYFWLQGSGMFHGRRYHLYLFRAEDDAEDRALGIRARERIRVAIFDAEGPHLADRPEYNEIVLGRQFVADDDRVQDDIGNGHEGQDPP